MRPASTMQALVDTYLAARRSMGFDLRIDGRQLCAFARFADQTGHRGPLTVAVAVRWAQSAPAGHPPDLGPPAPNTAAVHEVPRPVRSGDGDCCRLASSVPRTVVSCRTSIPTRRSRR